MRSATRLHAHLRRFASRAATRFVVVHADLGAVCAGHALTVRGGAGRRCPIIVASEKFTAWRCRGSGSPAVDRLDWLQQDCPLDVLLCQATPALKTRPENLATRCYPIGVRYKPLCRYEAPRYFPGGCTDILMNLVRAKSPCHETRYAGRRFHLLAPCNRGWTARAAERGPTAQRLRAEFRAWPEIYCCCRVGSEFKDQGLDRFHRPHWRRCRQVGQRTRLEA